MDTQRGHAADVQANRWAGGRVLRRSLFALLLAGGLGGCVYAPPYAAYDSTYPGYSYPAYVGPPVSVGIGLGYYEHRHSYRGGGHRHGWHHGYGWRDGRGHGRGHGWGRR